MDEAGPPPAHDPAAGALGLAAVAFAAVGLVGTVVLIGAVAAGLPLLAWAGVVTGSEATAAAVVLAVAVEAFLVAAVQAATALLVANTPH